MPDHPLQPNTRRSPYFPATEAAGATVYMAYNHMDMPMAYGRDPAEEYAALVERVTLWDVGAQRQCQLRGPDAVALADRLCARNLRELAVGECRYAFCCTPEGVIICDPVVLRVDEQTMWLSHGNVDLLLWARGVAVGAGAVVVVPAPALAPLQVQGPRSGDVLAALTGGSTDRLGPFRCMPVRIAGIDTIVSRTGWSHELGYEIYPLSSDRALKLWDAVLDAGRSHGILVTGPNIARAVESGLTDTNLATGMGINAIEANPRLVDLDGADFIGRDALRAIAQRGPERRQVGRLGPDRRLPRLDSAWTLRWNGDAVGATRWIAFSPRLERSIAIGLVRADLAEPGTRLDLEHPDGSDPVEVTTMPFVSRDLEPTTQGA